MGDLAPLPAEELLTPALLDALPSLLPLRSSLSALLDSSPSFPPRSLHVRATSNAHLVPSILAAVLSADDTVTAASSSSSCYHPVQRALPRAVQVDCSLVASQKALFARILNGLSGWGSGQWDDSLQGVLSWDGRQQGFIVSSGKSKGKGRAIDDNASDDDDKPSISWDYVANREQGSATGVMAERKDESLSGFLDGLKCVFSLGAGDKYDVQDDGDAPTDKYRDRPRFVVLHNVERLGALESPPVGQSEGTLLACFMRLRELVGAFFRCASLDMLLANPLLQFQTGKPIVPILVSTQEWLTLRPQRGATEPAASLELPALSQRDVLSFLPAYLGPALLPACTLPEQEASSLLAALVDLVYQTFSPYLGAELEDYAYLVEKLWPTWMGRVTSGRVQHGETARMVGLIRGELLAEIEALAELRPLPTGTTAGATSRDAAGSRLPSPTKATRQHHHPGTPTKQAPPLPGFGAPSPNFYSPSVTPSKSAHVGPSSSVQSNIASLAASLPLLSRYILISAFLASSNPSRKDLQMLATEEDDLFGGGRKKKKGGATRKTPQRKKVQLDANGVAKKEAVPQRLLGPKPFPIERLIAITECILPVELRSLAKSPDIMQQVRAQRARLEQLASTDCRL